MIMCVRIVLAFMCVCVCAKCLRWDAIHVHVAMLAKLHLQGHTSWEVAGG